MLGCSSHGQLRFSDSGTLGMWRPHGQLLGLNASTVGPSSCGPPLPPPPPLSPIGGHSGAPLAVEQTQAGVMRVAAWRIAWASSCQSSARALLGERRPRSESQSIRCRMRGWTTIGSAVSPQTSAPRRQSVARLMAKTAGLAASFVMVSHGMHVARHAVVAHGSVQPISASSLNFVQSMCRLPGWHKCECERFQGHSTGVLGISQPWLSTLHMLLGKIVSCGDASRGINLVQGRSVATRVRRLASQTS